MKKNIRLLLAVVTAAILVGCSNPALEEKVDNSGGLEIIKGEGTIRFSWKSPGQTGSRSAADATAAAAGNSVQDAKKILISMEHTTDHYNYFSNKELKLYNFNGSFLSEPFKVQVGEYRLTDYVVLNESGKVIFAAPKKNSKLAYLATAPLPINFNLGYNGNIEITPEIVDITGINPVDLGYNPFNFDNLKLLNFVVNVTSESYSYEDTVLDIKAGVKTYNFKLGRGPIKLYVNDMNENYSLTFTKRGHVAYKATYTNTELRGFLQNPLLINLIEDRPDNNLVSFADSRLEEKVRKLIKKPNGYIFTSDVAHLTSLNLRYGGIRNLSGIEKLTSLNQLDISNNSVSDFSPLSALTNLTDLNLYGNRIVDLTTLGALTSLTKLNLESNSIVDLTPLSALTNLTELNLESNNIVALTPLSTLTKLTILKLNYNKIVDLGPLSTLTNLTALDLKYNQIVNLSPLAALTTLTGINLSSNKIVDLSPLSPLTHLTTLNLDYNQIVELSPLTTLTNLAAVELSGNQIVNLIPLSTMISLTKLNLSRNSIVDPSPLSTLTNLTVLKLTGNKIVALDPLSALTNLTSLDLRANLIIALEPLTGLTNLSQLYLSENKIVDLSPLLNNSGIGAGDTVSLSWMSSLSTEAKNVQIPALKARGVRVYH